MCPLGLPGSAPAGMPQEHCSETFSVSPPHAWSLDHLHSVTFPGAPLYLSNRAMWLSLYTAALHLCMRHLPTPVCATPAHTCVCHSCSHLCVCHTCSYLCVCHSCSHLCVCHSCPHLFSTSWPCGPLVNSDVFFIIPSAASSTWPWAATCKDFGLLTVFFHVWGATATSQAFSASLDPEEDQLPSFPEGRVTHTPTLLCIVCKAKGESTIDFVSEVKASVGHLRMD